MRRPGALVLLATFVTLAAACADDSGRATPPSPATAAPATAAPPTTDAQATTTTTPEAAPGLAWHAPTATVAMTEFPNPDGATYEFGGEQFFFSGLAYLGPVGGSFEVRATRPDYETPIEATARLAGRRVELPADSVTDWTGLDGFIEVTVTDAGGAERLQDSLSFCPSGSDHIRVAPTGPVEDFGADDCFGHPFRLGASWSIAEGWAAAVTPFLAGDALEAGSYDLTMAIAPDYAEVLGDATVTIPIEITVDDSASSFDPGGAAFIDDDGDGIDDSEDPLVDTDGDGLDDRDPADVFVDADGDGYDDRTGLTEEATTDRTDQVSDQTIDGTDPDATQPEAAPEPPHQGRTGPDAHPPSQALPDLASLPALDISTSVDPDTGRDLLSFAAVTWNRGPAPMVIDGFARPDAPGFMDAYQQFGRVNGRDIGAAPIGTLEYHAGGGHDHWHFLAFSRYDLLTEDGGELQRSGKESWCLADTDAIDTTRPGVVRTQATTLGSACGEQDALWVRETLAVGWGDTYVQSVSGQAFDITDLPNGRYLIRLTANPDGTIYENDPSNDVADRLVILGGEPGARTVEVPPVGLVDSEAARGGKFFGE